MPHITTKKRKLSIRYITPAFSGSPWWGEINMATLPLLSWGLHGGEKSTLGSPWWGEMNLVKSGCGANEQKMEEIGETG